MIKQTDSDLSFFSFYNEPEKKPAYFEEKARQRGFQTIAAVAEEGTSSLAGPLVIAACIIPKNFSLKELHDIVDLTPKQTRDIYFKIVSHPGIVYAIEVLESSQIDEMSIFKASSQGMQKSIESLSKKPDFILVNGPLSPFSSKVSETIVNGHHLSLSIACASILAKKTRDAIMEGHDEQWPQYNFTQNKGYPTPEHLKTLKHLGPSPIHHKTYTQYI